MKDIKEQIDRIKQLFTEERLHGNLVENDSDELLSEASVVDIGYKTINNYMKNKVYTDGDKSVFLNKFATPKYFEKIKKLKEKRSKRSIGQVAIKTREYDEATNFFMVAADEGSRQSEFISALINYIKKEGFENIDTNNFSKTLKAHKTQPHSNGRIYKIFEVKGLEKPKKYQLDKEATPTDKEDNTDANKEVASNKSVQGINNNMFGAKSPKIKTDVPDVGISAIDDSGESQVSTAKNQPKSEPETEVKKDTPKPEPETEVKKGVTKTGDFTKPLQKLGGSQKGYTYHLIDTKKAVKKDKNGKVVATYIKESKLNRKSLFESVTTFDINNSLTENWKWVEGKDGQGQTFSNNLSDKFDKAIAQISGETPVDSEVSSSKGNTDSTNTSVDSGTETDTGDESTPAYECIEYDGEGEITKINGVSAFLIENEAGEGIYFLADGKLIYRKLSGSKIEKLTGKYDCNEDTFSLSNGDAGKLSEAMDSFSKYKGGEETPKAGGGTPKGGEETPKEDEGILDTAKRMWDNFWKGDSKTESVNDVKLWLGNKGKDFLIKDFAKEFPEIYEGMMDQVTQDESFEDFGSTLDPVGKEEYENVYKVLRDYDEKGLVPLFTKMYKEEYNSELLEDIESADDEKAWEDTRNAIIKLLKGYEDSNWWDNLEAWARDFVKDTINPFS